MNYSGILALEDGTIFYGTSAGITGYTVAQVVFNTSMIGYQEILTDPSYLGQIICFTYPHIGNVGINESDFESNKVYAKGIVARKISDHFSNWKATKSLKSFLLENNIIALSDIDTRKLTHLLKKNGSKYACIMSGAIDTDYAISLAQATRNNTVYESENINKTVIKSSACKNNTYQVLVVDFGVKNGILTCLENLGCTLKIISHKANSKEILSCRPDGIVLSNGPGDPNDLTDEIFTIKELLNENIPIFGICLGHQLLAIAGGAKIKKMNHGHHGCNHPVIDLENSKIVISSQNHEFTIEEESLPENIKITHRSLFDKTIEGIRYLHIPAFGFQGHPEASPGPTELRLLFDKFLEMMSHKCQKEQIFKKY